MTNKERVLNTLAHEQPDRVPFFYWGVPGFSEKMMAHLGFVHLDQLFDYLDVDFRWVEPEYIGPGLIDPKGYRKKDIWGVEYRLAGNGEFRYWDISRSPLRGITDVAALESYPWPQVTSFNFSSLDKQLEKYQGYAIMNAPGFSSPGLFRVIQKLVGRDVFLDLMVYYPKFFKLLVDKIASFYCEFINHFFAVTGNRVHFMRLADCFGSQGGLIVNHDTWNEIIKPVYARFTEIPKKHGVKIYMNSPGAVRKLLPEFISLGADVLGPVQTCAKGMSPDGLKKDFGAVITFCGAVDHELLLAKGSSEKVKDGVKSLLDKMAPGGGFILGPTHKFKVETPVENVIAMYEAAREWGS